MVRRNKDTRSWFDFACDYVDMKWPHTSPGQRKSTADSLIAITNALWTSQAGQPDQRVVNRALRTAYSSTARDSDHPAEIQRALRWISRHTRQTGELAKPDLLRALLAALDRNQSGERAAPDTVRLRRTTLRNALDYAVEKKLLDKNPMSEVKVKRQTTTLKQVDQRAVVNPTQARALLRAIRARNPRLEAFFGLLYYAPRKPPTSARETWCLPPMDGANSTSAKRPPRLAKRGPTPGPGVRHATSSTETTEPAASFPAHQN